MDWNADLTPEDRDAIIERAAQEIARRRLEVPGILFLELHRPFTFLASQALIVFGPLLAAFLRPDQVQRLSKLLEDRSNLDRLINRIEELAAERRDADAATSGRPDSATSADQAHHARQ
ncbi:MAG: hypothetical protein HY320_07925 [Armatimonadetes bacterium]|nr:hypothetical protein [Armatimonadota bacterium]